MAIAHTMAWAALNEVARREFWAALALRHCRGLGARSVARLLRTFGSALAAIEQIAAWGKAGVHADTAATFGTGSWRATARMEWDAAQRVHGHILLWTDERYPQLLREICTPPPVLYCQGDLSLLRSPCIAVVGSRRCSPAGRRLAKTMAGRLASCGIPVVSGMASGIDGVAHTAALQQIGRSIGVLGTGIDVAYPARNEQLFAAMRRTGLLISEFAPGSPARPGNFPVRNRIISGLARAVLVVEAAEQSGSLITARTALEENREVFVAAGSGLIMAAGARQLVEQGARVVCSADDILQELRPQLDIPIPLATHAPLSHLISSSSEDMPFLMVDKKFPSERADACQAHAEHTSISSREREQTNDSMLSPQTRPLPQTQVIPSGAPVETEKILRYIQTHADCHADTICDALGIAASVFSIAIIFLEMHGYVQRISGGRFIA